MSPEADENKTSSCSYEPGIARTSHKGVEFCNRFNSLNPCYHISELKSQGLLYLRFRCLLNNVHRISEKVDGISDLGKLGEVDREGGGP